MTEPSPTFAEQMLAKIETALLENPGAKSVTVGGVQVQYEDLVARRAYFQKEVAREKGNRPHFVEVVME